jgi:uncharacterized protein YbjT (DUF2867 family)
MKLFIAGGTGFVGRHLMDALAGREGVGGRCLIRSLDKIHLCKTFEPVEGSLEEMPPGALGGIDMVVHLVGIIGEDPSHTFESVHVRGTERLVDEALKAGVRHFFYQSALGASLSSKSAYMRTKARAEEIIRDSGMAYTIFRPSLILGPDDFFTREMVGLITSAPVIPIPGDGERKFQPIYIDDWVKCFLSILRNPKYWDRVIELGGPEYITFNGLVRLYMEILGIKKKIMHVPVKLAKGGVRVFGLAKKIGLKNLPPLSRDQLELLSEDNTTALDALKRDFGFEPVNIRKVLPEFLPGLISQPAPGR